MRYKISLDELVERPIQLFRAGTIQGVALTGEDNVAYREVRDSFTKAEVPLKGEDMNGYYSMDLSSIEVTDIPLQAI